jgi:hypothetical protein
MKSAGLGCILRIAEIKEVTYMERAMAENSQDEGYISIWTVIDELEKDLTPRVAVPKKEEAVSGKAAILEILARAADDHKFLARLAGDSEKVLMEYDLTSVERAALATGDLRKIESWVGKLDKRMCTWIWCRLQQEKW